MNLVKGFTLVEIMVVLSIISLLSSTTLATVKVARDKTIDASIKEIMQSIRTEIEIYNSQGSSFVDYGTATTNATHGHRCLSDVTTDYGPQLNTNNVFTNDSLTAKLIERAVKLSLISTNSFPPDWFNEDLSFCYVSQNPLSYMVSVPLKNSPGLSWCIDSRNNSTTLHNSDLNIMFRDLNNGTGVDCLGANF